MVQSQDYYGEDDDEEPDLINYVHMPPESKEIIQSNLLCQSADMFPIPNQQ